MLKSIAIIIAVILVIAAVIWIFGGMARIGDNRNIKTGEPND